MACDRVLLCFVFGRDAQADSFVLQKGNSLRFVISE